LGATDSSFAKKNSMSIEYQNKESLTQQVKENPMSNSATK
jgi:hypothetical protein